MLTILKQVLEYVWNIRFLKGKRTTLARLGITLLGAYQAAATSPDLIQSGVDLPDMNSVVFAGLLSYFALKVKQFAQEHEA